MALYVVYFEKNNKRVSRQTFDSKGHALSYVNSVNENNIRNYDRAIIKKIPFEMNGDMHELINDYNYFI